MGLAELKQEVDRRQAGLDEARKVYDRTNIEARDASLVRYAEFELLRAEAQRDLAMAREAKVAAVEAIRFERAPPDLQALVLAHGTWDQITLEAWAIFNADMAEWKHKMREGLFSVYPWKSGE